MGIPGELQTGFDRMKSFAQVGNLIAAKPWFRLAECRPPDCRSTLPHQEPASGRERRRRPQNGGLPNQAYCLHFFNNLARTALQSL
jgi:hypothetical protein